MEWIAAAYPTHAVLGSADDGGDGRGIIDTIDATHKFPGMLTSDCCRTFPDYSSPICYGYGASYPYSAP